MPVDLLGLSTFVKYAGECLMGYAPGKMQQLARQAGKPASEMPVKLMAPPRVVAELRQEVGDVYQNLTADLVKAHKDFKSKEKRSVYLRCSRFLLLRPVLFCFALCASSVCSCCTQCRTMTSFSSLLFSLPCSLQ
jgi:hypothetical protein